MKNFFEKGMFFSLLQELLSSDISLEKSLLLLSKEKKIPKSISAAASEIYEVLLSGQTFSFALSVCTELKFSPIYISLFSCTEQTGSIAEALLFVKESEDKKKNAFSELKVLAAYPLFILILIFFGTFFLWKFGSDFVARISLDSVNSEVFTQNLILGSFLGGSFAFLVCFAEIILGVFIFKPDLITYSFQTLFFLTKSGVSLYQSILCVLEIVSGHRQIETFFSETIKNLQNGISDFFLPERVLDSHCSMLLSLNEKNNSLQNTFKNIALHYEKKNQIRRQIFIRFIEPSLLCAVAGYLIILLLCCSSMIGGL